MEELKDIELYEFLGILQSSSVDEIKSAYRKKALKCHPDKNPDNPKAVELFHKLTKALEVLIDPSARDAYDKVLNAKKAAKLRNQELDSKRRKFKEDLEAREREFSTRSNCDVNSADAAVEQLKKVIERLRKENSKLLQDEIELVRQQVQLEKEQNASTPVQKRLKIRWSCSKEDDTNGGYDNEILHKIFSKYGDIEALVISAKKKGSALIEFTTPDAANNAQKYESGLPSNPITLEWLEKPSVPTATPKTFNISTPPSEQKKNLFPSSDTNAPLKSSATFLGVGRPVINLEYESLVLRQMRQAEERKRLIEQMKENDET